MPDVQIERGRIEFLAVLAHEIRNPLAAIGYAVDVLGAHTPGSTTFEQSRTLIKNQLRTMRRLTEDLLEVTRIETGKLALNRERVDLGNVIWTATESLRLAIDTGCHTLIVQVPEQPFYADVDPMRLVQVLSNLIDNSAKFSERCGRITVSLAREAGEAIIRVRDEGIGISTDTLPHIFELFVQGKPSAHGPRQGLGIGLNLVKRIVESHGGTVGVHSEGAGTGSEFIVRLPALDAGGH